MTKKKKIKKEKWVLNGFYFDGKDHYDLYKNEVGVIKHIKRKNKLKVC